MPDSSAAELTVDAVNRAVIQHWSDAPGRCVSISRDQAEMSMSLAGVSLRPGGYVPGPTQFAAADLALWFLAFGALNRVEPMALTSELSIRFLRPGVGARLSARAVLERCGRTSLIGTVRVWTDDNVNRPCAAAQGSYSLPRCE